MQRFNQREPVQLRHQSIDDQQRVGMSGLERLLNLDQRGLAIGDGQRFHRPAGQRLFQDATVCRVIIND